MSEDVEGFDLRYKVGPRFASRIPVSDWEKIITLREIGIEVQSNEDPLAAWNRAMHEENGLEWTGKPDNRFSRCIASASHDLQLWIWWLA